MRVRLACSSIDTCVHKCCAQNPMASARMDGCDKGLCLRIAPKLTCAAGVQDLVVAMALSEAVYRLMDAGEDAALSHIDTILAILPASTVPALQVQCSLPSVSHRYVANDALPVWWLHLLHHGLQQPFQNIVEVASSS